MSHETGCYAMAVHRVGAQQCASADHVEDPRHSYCQPVNLRKGCWGKYVAGRAGHAQAMSHVGCGLVVSQRVEVVAPRDALGQLSQLVTPKELTQLRLADENDLQELARVGFQVSQQAHLVENARCEVLCLVDHYYDAAAAGMSAQQVAAEDIHQVLEALGSGVR